MNVITFCIIQQIDKDETSENQFSSANETYNVNKVSDVRKE